MYKHLLLPSDGSKLAAKGFKAGVAAMESEARGAGVPCTVRFVAAPSAA